MSFIALLDVKKLRLLTLIIFFSGCFSPVTAADGLQLVTGQDTSVKSLSRAETANLFLGVGRAKVNLKPFDSSDKKLREEFYREVTGLSPARVRAHWAKRVFTGRGRPPKAVELKDVKKLIKLNPTAVTYVPSQMIPSNAKQLLQLSMEGGK